MPINGGVFWDSNADSVLCDDNLNFLVSEFFPFRLGRNLTLPFRVPSSMSHVPCFVKSVSTQTDEPSARLKIASEVVNRLGREECAIGQDDEGDFLGR